MKTETIPSHQPSFITLILVSLLVVAALLLTAITAAWTDPLSVQANDEVHDNTVVKSDASSGKASFVLELDIPPVAVVYAQSMGSGVHAANVVATTQTQLATVEEEQQALLARLEALDVEVLYRTQRVFNGIAVRATAQNLKQIEALPGIKAIYPLIRKVPMHDISLPLIGAPELWDGFAHPALTGQGVRIAVIDTGIDYIHSDLGGFGNLQLYDMNDPTLISDAMPFPNYKVRGGWDLVGDDYDADPDSPTYQPTPHPDPDPMDCYGHGTHVAGTVAGNGVLQDGSTYFGPYNSALDLSTTTFRVAPGVAPKAQIYALKIFGCTGSSEVTDLAIEWAMDPNGDGDLSDHMDVINMSLGSTFGAVVDVSTIASNNAAAAGVIVVASAGNSGDVHFVTGSPAVADRVISVAASSYDSLSESDLLASFSSRGPRRGDAALKPDLAAPGVNISSAGAGTGTLAVSNSGTSMAAPHVAGSMALLHQLHPDWSVQELKALVMNSAQPAIRVNSNISSATYTSARIGAGRIDLRAAISNTLLSFDADKPELVSISFGMPEISETLRTTRALAILNKGISPVSATVEYLARVDLPGAEVELPNPAVVVAPGGLVTVPVVLRVDPIALKRSIDDTLNDEGSAYHLSEEMGTLEIVPEGDADIVRVPLYAAPKPSSTLRAEQDHFEFGSSTTPTFTLVYTGSGLTTDMPTEGYESLVSLLELQWNSPNTPPIEPDYPEFAIGDYDSADIHYLGIANDLHAVASLNEATLYFGIATYAPWSTPNEVQFSIFIDSDQDGVDDYRLFNTNQFSILSDRFASDRFAVGFEDLQTKAKTVIGTINSLPANAGDAALFDNNVMILPVKFWRLGLADGKQAFNYRLESEIAELGGIIDRSPVLHYRLQQQLILPLDEAASPTQKIIGGETRGYQFDALGSGGEATALLFFHHNGGGQHNGDDQRTQLIELKADIKKLYFPLIAK